MPAITPILRGTACCVLLAVTLAGTAEACERRPQPPVVVTVGADGMPAVDRDPIRACEGDEIRWVFRGAARQFAVIFTDAANSPFTWDRETGATVIGTVRSGAAQVGSFKYDVEVDGRRLDPQIIIER